MSLEVPPVENDEILFRCVSFGRGQCIRDEAGRGRLSSQAFTDRNFRPSVDRSRLCAGDPRHTQFSDSDGVVSLLTADVREISFMHDSVTYQGEVIADPIGPANLAHAVISTAPPISQRNVFRKLLERLGHLAEVRGWMIEPRES